MSHFNPITTGVLALLLAACGNAGDTAPAQAAPAGEAATAIEPSVNHSGHDMADTDAPGDGTGHATGSIVSLAEAGDYLSIDHGPIDGIGMGAMTMGFETLNGVDLSGYSAGDPVAFMVKQGRDGSYRVAAICNTAVAGADCLVGLMDR